MFKFRITLLLLMSVLLVSVCGAEPSGKERHHRKAPHRPAWSVDDLFASPTPFALGHRGYGINTGEDPTRPIENTLDGFRRAFKDGIRVIELDLQQTADGKIVVIHDDVTEDSTCISALTYREFHERKPEAPLFRAVLHLARHFGHARQLSGIIFAEIKPPVPFCDDANTSERAAVSESALVSAVVAEIRRAGMEDQVILNSGSPTILRHAALQTPEIKRALTLDVLQLLPPEVVAQLVHLPVVRIPKDDFGLAWYNVGVIARLPAMPSFPQFVGISLAVGSRAVSVDKRVLFQAGPAAPNLVTGLHGAGLKAIIWTVDTAQDWDFVVAAGADGITTNNIAFALANQAPLPSLAARDDDDGDSEDGEDEDGNDKGHGRGHRAALTPAEAESNALVDVSGPKLALYPPRTNPSRDGAVCIEFLLPDGEAAHLALVDIAGRMVDSHDVGSFGPGRHEVTLGRNLSPGIYLVRLSHRQGLAQIKAAVTR